MRGKAGGVLVALAALVVLAGGAGQASAGIEGFERCGKVPDLGGKSPVHAANVRCERALKIASAFIEEDDLPERWKTYNPAGCEFFLFRRGERRELLEWVEDHGPIETKVIYTIKTRGCES